MNFEYCAKLSEKMRSGFCRMPHKLLCKRGTKRVILLVGPSTRVADESAGLRLALATPSWTIQRPPAATDPPAGMDRPAAAAVGGAISDLGLPGFYN